MLFNGSIRGTDASDVAQRTVAAAMEHFPSFRGASDSEWYAWLLAIVKNDIRRLLRDAQREARLVDTIPPPTELHDATPSRFARQREETVRLFAAMEQLPERDRQVIQLRNIDGLPYAEVASQLGCSEQSARQRWVRAVRRLSRDLKDLA